MLPPTAIKSAMRKQTNPTTLPPAKMNLDSKSGTTPVYMPEFSKISQVQTPDGVKTARTEIIVPKRFFD